MPGASGLGEVGGRAREPDLGRATSAGGGYDKGLSYILKLSAIAEAEEGMQRGASAGAKVRGANRARAPAPAERSAVR